VNVVGAADKKGQMKNSASFKSQIASGLAELRKSRRVTQEELAKMLNTKQSVISRIESGAAIPSWEFINRIVKVLNAEVEITFISIDSQEVFVYGRSSKSHEYICVNCLHRWESSLKQTVLQCPNCHKRQGVLFSEYTEMLEAFQKLQQAVREAPPPRKAPPVKSLIKNIPPMLKMVLEGAEKTFPSPRLPVSLLFRILEQSRQKEIEKTPSETGEAISRGET
jgi:transcriptional regulator with XRE-family HTH domain